MKPNPVIPGAFAAMAKAVTACKATANAAREDRYCTYRALATSRRLSGNSCRARLSSPRVAH